MKSKLYYPVNLDLQHKACVVIGGGDVAWRKARSLLACGAAVTVVSPQVKDKMAALIRSGKVRRLDQSYQKAHLKGAFLVVAATNDVDANKAVARDAAARNILVNVVDVPALCNFIVPAVIRRGPLAMAVSTGGQSPLLAKALRKKCEKCLKPAHGDLARALGAARKDVQRCCKTASARKAAYQKIMKARPFAGLL
ncbi:MAG: bifunctional precorrin-2 dehydrogenase/sirohydrochlorin ferrochelatase [Candidatus Omnitrophica bacterium]|nr:bifunctional precorrin-2 dehydrogenase/sirohydrochlorin ferrochelatase [Candidatus Omnitrophota bacterium]